MEASYGELTTHRHLTWTKRGKVCLMVIFSAITNCDNVVYVVAHGKELLVVDCEFTVATGSSSFRSFSPLVAAGVDEEMSTSSKGVPIFGKGKNLVER